jgi:hypothetical protein
VVTWKVTVEFADEEEARGFFAMVSASRQDMVPLVWFNKANSKYASLRSVTGFTIRKEPPSDS